MQNNKTIIMNFLHGNYMEISVYIVFYVCRTCLFILCNVYTRVICLKFKYIWKKSIPSFRSKSDISLEFTNNEAIVVIPSRCHSSEQSSQCIHRNVNLNYHILQLLLLHISHLSLSII